MGMVTAGAVLATSSVATSATRADDAVSASKWRALQRSLRGRLVMADDAGYASDRLLYNARFANPLPRAIAYCASADDVARCVDFATSHHVDLTSRSGGHSYAGYSTCPGLVVDVSAMSGVRVDVATLS